MHVGALRGGGAWQECPDGQVGSTEADSEPTREALGATLPVPRARLALFGKNRSTTDIREYVNGSGEAVAGR